MKKTIFTVLALLAVLPAFQACEKDLPDADNSIIVVNKKDRTPFDDWLDENYVHPYNIMFKYRYQMDESNLSYFSIPADYDAAIMLAHIIKYMSIDTYDEVAGIDFTRRYFPKLFFLLGEFQYKNNGTMTLATAEGGKKIVMMGVNWVPSMVNDIADLNHYYLKTIHHEFTHILNQTKDFPVSYSQVTPTLYVSDSWNDTDNNYLSRGFLTKYSQHSDREDFAEMMSTYVTNNDETWAGWLTTAGAGASHIVAKLDIVKEYMLSTFNIDLDQLRATVLRRQDELVAGKVDLTSLETK